MKTALTLCLLAWLAVTIHPGYAARSSRLDPVDYAGRRYVRLGDWARVNNFEGRWLKRDETLQLGNHNSQMVFSKDSRQAELNGPSIWLSFPIVVNAGAAFIS